MWRTIAGLPESPNKKFATLKAKVSLRSRERNAKRKALRDESAYHAQTLRSSIPRVSLFSVMIGKGIAPSLAREILAEIPHTIRGVANHPILPPGKKSILASLLHAPLGTRKVYSMPKRARNSLIDKYAVLPCQP